LSAALFTVPLALPRSVVLTQVNTVGYASGSKFYFQYSFSNTPLPENFPLAIAPGSTLSISGRLVCA
jgi:hypothetical protein